MTFYSLIAAPIIGAAAYGLAGLLWTAIGFKFPRARQVRRRRVAAGEAATRPPAAMEPKPIRLARLTHNAAVPQESWYDAGSHIDN